VGALSVSGPSSRLPEDLLHADIGRAVLASAERLSQELGYRS
jgi:DNA-binding IclR family transcriptional regulator